MNGRDLRWWYLIALMLTGFFVIGCDGSSGAPGAAGPAGPAGPPGPTGPPGNSGSGIPVTSADKINVDISNVSVPAGGGAPMVAHP